MTTAFALPNDLDESLPRLRALLEEQRQFRRDQLVQLAAQHHEAHVEVAGRHVDDLDASADSARIEVSAAVAAAARQALVDIDAALDRMRAGRYGRFVECAAEIPIERLYAIPQAGLCMRCQSRIESRR